MILTRVTILVFLIIPQNLDYPSIKLGTKSEVICEGQLVCTDLRKFSEFKTLPKTHKENSDHLNRLVPEFKFYIGEVFHLLDPLENIELLHKDCVILVERVKSDDWFIFYNENESEWREITGCFGVKGEKQTKVLEKIAQTLDEGKMEQRKIYENRIMPLPIEFRD